MNPPPRLCVLLVEDNPGEACLIGEMLAEAEGATFHMETASTLEDGLKRLAAGAVDAVLLDLSLPDSLGLDSFRRVHAAAADVPVVVLSGHEDEELAARAVQEGAQDYLVKGQVDALLLGRSLRYAVERGRIEEQLRRRAGELREADRRKDEFLAMLAHELRAPLPSILAAVEVLKNERADPGSASWARDTLDRQVGNLARLLEDLLDVSRFVHGKITVRKEPVRLGDVVSAALETAVPVLDERDVRLSVSLPEEPVRLEADPTRMEQVIVNLLHNAAAYSDPGGPIWLEASCEEGEAVLRVRDAGAGMEPGVAERVFEPFAQAGVPYDGPGGGLGLGLALVRALAELHGGKAVARSDGPGRGSEFEVRLPGATVEAAKAASSAAGASGPGPADSAPSGAEPAASGASAASGTAGPSGGVAQPASGAEDPRGLRVLIVDDNRDTARGLALIVDMWGHDVAVANDGARAIELARERPPDLVLLDIGMPEMDGYAVARALRSDPATADSLLWALTGYGREEDARRSREAGFHRHLKKPLPTDELRRMLAELAAARGGDRPSSSGPPSRAPAPRR